MKYKTLKFIPLPLIGLCTILFSFAIQARIAKEDCEIKEPNDVSQITDGGYPYEIVFDVANRGTQNGLRYCSKKIVFETNVNFKDNLTIAIPEIKESDNYIIEGNVGGQPAVLDFSGIKSLRDGRDPHKLCAILFKNTKYITFKNIIVQAGPFHAVCVGGKEDGPVKGVIFDNVKIDGAEGHGFIFNKTAKDNIILANSSILNVDKDAIRVLSDKATDFNLLQSTNRIPKNADPETGLLDPETGFEAPVDEEGNAVDEQNFSFYGSQNFVSSKRAVRVRIATPKQLDPENPNVFLIQGQVVQASSDEEVCNAALGVRGITRLQIYSAQRQVGKVGAFLTYVMPSTTDSLLGIVTASEVQGRFSFVYDKSKYLAEYIAILPELSSSDQRVPNGTKIASSSRIIQVTDRNPEGVIVCPGEEGSSGTTAGFGAGVGGASGTAGIVNAFTTVSQCMQRIGTGPDGKPLAHAGETRDSDGDGISDFLEDSDGDCIPTNNDISSWLSPDSDHDGIPDLQELNGASLRDVNLLKKVNSVLQRRPETFFCGFNADNSSAGSNVIVIDLCNIDKDSMSNANDTDSDGDGIDDYREDRSVFFSESDTGYLYYYNGVTSDQPVSTDAQGRPILTCTFTADRRSVGVEYGLYIVTPAQQQTVVAVEPWDGNKVPNRNIGEVIRVLACKNATVSSTNFNGRGDGNTETNPYDENSIAVDIDRIGDCSVVLRNVRDKRSNDGSIREWLEANKNDPEKIKRECNSDIDTDGIPDCVELPSGQCGDIIKDTNNDGIPDNFTSRHLNPFDKDTDGDNVPDRIDLDPFQDIPGKDDEYPDTDVLADDAVSGINRAQLYRVFENNPYLMLFVDRDQDEINDGEEVRSLRMGPPTLNSDKLPAEMYGPPNCSNLETSMDPRCNTDTDPLRKDTDNDSFHDKTEVRTWGRKTNPASDDTDGDGLGDRLEVIGDTITVNIIPVGSGCAFLRDKMIALDANAFLGGIGEETKRLGTNPYHPDTDGDGIWDGQELRCDTALGDDISSLLTPSFPAGGINICSNPLSPDSDGDGLKDGDEYGADGVIDWGDSNPCDRDTDHTQGIDGSDACNTSTDPNATCAKSQTGVFSTGTDTDGDKLSNEQELNSEYKSDPNRADSDGDGLSDGEEDANQNGRFEPNLGESHPVNADTDGDRLRDSFERQFNSDPNVADTDRDGIPDGTEIIGQNSLDTDPTNPDTDGDGLCDGGRAVNFAGAAGNVNCIRGEDINENGVVDKDPKNPNQVTETDPRNPDSDSDGENDKDEICHGGSCNITGNLGRATQGKSEGCFSVSGRHSGDNRAPTSIFYLLGLLLIGNRFVTRRLRKVG